MGPRAARFALATTLIAFAVAAGACRARSAAGTDPGPDDAPIGPSNAASLTLAARPLRIVSLAPSLTEFLFALGAGDRVVGVTRFCDRPPEAARLPRVGGLVDLDVETVLALRPDLVVAVDSTRKRGFLRPLAAAGVPTYWTVLDSEEDVYRVARELAGLVADAEAGERVVADIQRGMAAVEARLAGAPERRTLLVYGHEPLVVAGAGSFADALIRRAGGVNVAGDSPLPFPTWSVEEAIRAAPDVILENFVGTTGPGDAWDRWQSIPAVRDGRVHRLTDTAALRPGPALPEALESVARRIHPERFEKEPR